MINLQYNGAGVKAVANGCRNSKVVNGRAKATGQITFTGNFVANDKVVINGKTFTAVAAGAAGDQFNIGASLSASLDALVTLLNGSAYAEVAAATYAKSGTTILTISNDTPGEAGNAFTYSASVGTAAGSKLTGGADANKIDVNKHSVFFLVTNDNVAETFVLNDGMDLAQTITILLLTKGASANAIVSGVFNGGTSLTFDTAGKLATLIWNGSKWQPVANTGSLA